MCRNRTVAALAVVLVLWAQPAHAAATPGDDDLFGTNGDNVIRADGGADVVFGLRGDDRIFGEAGDDVIVPGKGRDRVSAGTSSDSLFQAVYDDEGTDVVRLPDAVEQFTWVFVADGAPDVVSCNDPEPVDPPEEFVFADVTDEIAGSCSLVLSQDFVGSEETLPWYVDFGSKRDNRMTADPQLSGFLFGKGGNDRLEGGAGNNFGDVLIGGPGRDRMTGDSGDVIVDGDGTSGDVMQGNAATNIYAADGAADTIDCGDGVPSGDVYVDPQDTLISCEGAVIAE